MCSRYLANYSVDKMRREMSNPKFMIEHGDVTAYIVSTAPRVHDEPVTTHMLSDILFQHIGYTPWTFIQKLVGLNSHNTDLECMVVLYSLLMMDFLPPSGLRGSMNRILYSHDGNHLMRHLVGNLDNEASHLLERQLGRIS